MSQGTIYVENRDTADLFVTIYDRNTASADPIWNKQRLNDDETKSLTCEIDGDGEANLEWIAERTDDPTVKSSATEKVDENSTLEVYAN